jgi:hypothetical protein
MQPEYNSSFWHLAQALRNNQVVAFVGAGISRAILDIPTWNECISDLLIDVKNKTGAKNPYISNLLDCLMQRVEEREEDLLFAAEQCRKYLLSEFDNSMAKLFNTSTIRDQNAKNSLEVLLRLPFYRIITTNYDNLLIEVARSSQPNRDTEYFTHLDSGCFADFLRHGDTPKRRLIFHLHGHMSRPDSVILAESQYQELYTTREVTDLLEAIFASKSALFIGFSLADEDIMQIFRRIIAKFRPVREQHFALIARDPDGSTAYANWLDSLRYNYKYGLGLIYYPLEGKSHKRLWDLVGALDREVNKPREKLKGCVGIVMDEGFPYSRNLWEIITFLNEVQGEIHYELVNTNLKVNLDEGFKGTLKKDDPSFPGAFRKVITFREANREKYDGILIFTAKRDSKNYFFFGRKWGGFVSTCYWDRYVLGSEEGEPKNKAIRYVKRPSIDEYLWHTTVILTVHFYDTKFHKVKLLVPHHPDIGCIFDFTEKLRNRLAIIEYPVLCTGCKERLEEVFAEQKLKLSADWLRRVIPLAE